MGRSKAKKLMPSSRVSKTEKVQSSLAEGRRVLEIEARAVQSLVDRLDAKFAKAVDLLVQCKGKVVVSGMGKSGLIGQKIAATLASTGTSSKRPSASMPSAAKQPRSTAAMAGKYEFETRSGSATFIVTLQC